MRNLRIKGTTQVKQFPISENEEIKVKKRRIFGDLLGNILRLTRNIALFFLFLFSALYIILQMPAVQNAAARKVTETLSEELNTTVSLDNISIEFFDKLVLSNFYIEHPDGDTLLFSRELKANVKTDIPALLRRKLVIEEITLNQAEFNLRRDSGELRNSLGFIQDYFARPDTTVLADEGEKKPFYLDVDAVYLNDIHFTNSDIYKGEDLDIRSGKINIQIEELNLPENLLQIASIDISNPIVEITQYDWLEEIRPDTPDIESDFRAEVERLDLAGGQLIIDNLRRSPEKLTSDNQLDLNHLRVFDADISIRDFAYQDWVFTGEIASVSARDRSGFKLENLSVKEAKVTERRAQFNDLELITPDSRLGDTLIFKYRRFPDWREFPSRVLMDIRFDKNSSVRVGDVMAFAPALENNAFFRRNREEVIKIQGNVSGKVSNLKARDLVVSLAGNTYLRGNFNTRNLNVKDEQYLDLRLDRLVTNIQTLKQVIPNFNPPANFDKLGNIDFRGQFNGFFVDFVAYGKLQSDLGSAELDMRMNLKEGREKAKYSGQISLTDFDLATWTGNPDFGNVTFISEVKNGIGLTGETARADLTAAVQNFTFRGYTYDNLNIAGNLQNRFFNGDFTINDQNVVFDFKGKVDFTRPKPLFDFNANVKRLALLPLNLAKKDLVLQGKINRLFLENTKIADITGEAQISDFSIVQNERDTFAIDTVSILSEIAADSTKRFFVNSDLARAELTGRFDLSKIPQTFTRFFYDNFPDFATRLNVKNDTTVFIPPQAYAFDIDIFDSKNFNRLINPGLGNLANIKVDGYLDNIRDSLEWDINVPILQFNRITATDISTYGETIGSEGDLNFEVFETQLNPKITLPPLKLLSIVDRDTLDFALNLISNSDLLDNINLDGEIYPHEDLLELTLNNSALIFLSDIWTIEEGNYLRAGKGRVEAQNFRLTSEGREIELYTVGERSLEVNAENFDLSFINEIWKDPRFLLGGPFTLNARADNIFGLEGLHAYVEADTFRVNGDDWGVLRLDASTKNLRSRVDAYVNMYQAATGQQLLAEGYFNPANLEVAPGDVALNKQVPNYLNFDVQLAEFPVSFLEYLIQNGISNTVGTLDADFKMHGKLNRLVMDGRASVFDLGVTIDYLKTRYFAHNQTVVLRENMIDATGGFITDELGNKAYVFGGLIHNYMKNWGPAVRVTGDNFLVLNTTKKDNDLYYGRGIGAGDVNFSGTFRSTNIDVIAKTGPGTQIAIPVSYDREADEVSFIRFKNRDKIVPEDQGGGNQGSGSIGKIEGLNVTIDLELTPDADMKMIFDEQTGDIIQGRGSGNIRMTVPRGLNEFFMFGNYEIEQGEYLFTAVNIVNKPFIVQRGGTIIWTGDPFGADIDLVAEYKDLNVAPYNFIQEYLVSTTSDVQALARQATKVDLKMLLRGDLLKPDISFDIDFPNLRAEMKAYVDSKMRVVSRDQNELNRQVFGLIVAGQFLPTAPSLQNEVVATGLNTLTEMLSQQLSIYLTEVISGWLTEDGFISGIDFDIGYSRFQNADIEQSARANNELQVRMKNYLFDDKIAVNAGVNIDLDNDAGGQNVNNGAFYAGDFAVEYFLTPDKQFKVRFYQSIQPELGGRRNKTGLGLSYRKEFDSFREFLRGMRKATKRIKG